MEVNIFLMTCIDYWQQPSHRYFCKISVIVLQGIEEILE